MAALIIESIDDETLRRLETIAHQNKRTVEAEAMDIIRQATARTTAHAELVRRANEIAAMTPKGIAQTDSVELLRRDRAR